MRRIALVASVVGLCLSTAAVCADPGPAPPWDETLADPTSFDFTVTNPVAGDPYTYRWDVTFNGGAVGGAGATNYRWAAFVVYGPHTDPGTNDPAYSVTATDSGWGASKDGAAVTAEWSGSDIPLPPQTRYFQLTFKPTVDLTGFDPNKVAIHVKWDGGSYYKDGELQSSAWVNNTPELPPSLLSMIGFGGLAFLRRRRLR